MHNKHLITLFGLTLSFHPRSDSLITVRNQTNKWKLHDNGVGDKWKRLAESFAPWILGSTSSWLDPRSPLNWARKSSAAFTTWLSMVNQRRRGESVCTPGPARPCPATPPASVYSAEVTPSVHSPGPVLAPCGLHGPRLARRRRQGFGCSWQSWNAEGSVSTSG